MQGLNLGQWLLTAGRLANPRHGTHAESSVHDEAIALETVFKLVFYEASRRDINAIMLT